MKVELLNSEIVDKYITLSIQSVKMDDNNQVKSIEKQISELKPVYDKLLSKYGNLMEFYSDRLKIINEVLFEIECRLNESQKCKQYDETFIKYSKTSYLLNDMRCDIKRDIDLMCKSK